MEAYLDKIERKAPSTILELAVWKAALLISDGASKSLYDMRTGKDPAGILQGRVPPPPPHRSGPVQRCALSPEKE